MIVTSRQMRECERLAAQNGMSYLQMMENAGEAAARWIGKTIPIEGVCVTVFCGKGNNGGDGFVVARRLHQMGADVAVILAQGEPKTPDAQEEFSRLGEEIPIIDFSTDVEGFILRVRQTAVIVDAVYGMGFHGELTESAADLCRVINASGAAVFSIDVPSGVNADTGECARDAVRAQYTGAIHLEKPAHAMACCRKYCGQVQVLDIGISREFDREMSPEFVLQQQQDVWSRLPTRQKDANKGTYGKLLNIAGCLSMSGAAYMSTMAALRCGAGLVTLATTRTLTAAFAGQLPGATFLPLEENKLGFIEEPNIARITARLNASSACLIGCGLSTQNSAVSLVEQVLRQAQCPVVVDADGLNAVSTRIDLLTQSKAALVLTPHVGEMARLTGKSIAQIKASPYQAALEFAKAHQVVVVLKDSTTIIAGPDGRLFTNTTGNPGLAKGGSGDVLAGMIAGFLAQGISAVDSAVCAVYLHGWAADRCAARRSQYGMQPIELLEDLLQIFAENGR